MTKFGRFQSLIGMVQPKSRCMIFFQMGKSHLFQSLIGTVQQQCLLRFMFSLYLISTVFNLFLKKVGQPFHRKFPQSLDSTGFFIFVKIGSEVHRLFYRIFSNLLFECPTLNFYRKPKISMQSIAAFISSV